MLNRYAFGYSNGFLEGINNTSKVIKRHAFGFRKYEHFKAKVLLSRVYKEVGIHLG
ncbi:transposase [Solibacillus sp. FSL R7-0682]|uniref:transposase n=1 Tax=Solibacillus sp. FSL R7-0682 TaxID=2921690 RepID=UPI004040A865